MGHTGIYDSLDRCLLLWIFKVAGEGRTIGESLGIFAVLDEYSGKIAPSAEAANTLVAPEVGCCSGGGA